MKPYYPIYARSPNKLLRYYLKQHLDTNGDLQYTERVAVYLDKGKEGNEKEMTAQIIWPVELQYKQTAVGTKVFKNGIKVAWLCAGINGTYHVNPNDGEPIKFNNIDEAKKFLSSM